MGLRLTLYRMIVIATCTVNYLKMSRLLTALFIWGLASFEVKGQSYGLIYSEITGKPENFSQHCFAYDPRFHELPQSVEEAVTYRLVDLLPSIVCEDSDVATKDFSNSVVAVKRGNCTFSEKATIVQDHKGKAVLIVSKEKDVIPSANQTSDYKRINITVAVIHEDDFNDILTLGDDISVQLYAPAAPRVDYNLVVIWVLATFTVAAGAYWSGTVKQKQALKRMRKQQSGRQGEAREEDDEDEADALDISPSAILVFVVLMCGMLLSLYYLFRYLVYVVIAMFTLASAMSMYACLKPLMLRLCGSTAVCRLPSMKLPCSKKRHKPEVRCVLLAVVCTGVAVTWAVLRKEWYAWIIQDILGVMFCMNMMKTLRLPSLQACSILLILLFVYDVFFVFITPLLTKDGESIMVQVATGGGGGKGSASAEKLPMVLMVPRFYGTPCSMLPYSMLGFGDILVPGLLVSYCYGFDLQVASGKVYYFTTCIGYGVGMVITFAALAYMEIGQPALLYLVPCTLIPTVLVALKRGELRRIWNGKNAEQKYKDEMSGPDDNDGPDPVPVNSNTPGISHRNNTSNSNLAGVVTDGDSVSNASSTDSQALLINK